MRPKKNEKKRKLGALFDFGMLFDFGALFETCSNWALQRLTYYLLQLKYMILLLFFFFL